jgi:hypothetical protein
VSSSGDERHYVRAVEAAWSKRLGRPGVVSPREFEVIDTWRRRGIPLAVVLEAIRDFGTRRSGRAPRSLSALAHAVHEAWAAVASGRSAPPVADARPERSDARRAWQEALARCAENTPLHTLLSSVLSEEANGVAPDALDAALDASLPAAAPVELVGRVTDETARALGGFGERMTSGEFQKTFSRALADRLRAELGLPRLALTR